jgi:tol-pal system protein YbgF
MTRTYARAFHVAAAAALVLATGLSDTHAQDARSSRTGETGFFDQIFGGSDRFGGNQAPSTAAPAQMAQVSPSELVLRLDRLENQVRQLTGLVEQLQYRNQQLEQQLRRGDAGGASPPARPQTAQPGPPPGPPIQPQRRSELTDPNDAPYVPGAVAPTVVPPGAAPPAVAAPAPARLQGRADAFDPNEHPTAPGAPRTLGSLPSGPTVVTGDADEDIRAVPPVGAPGGRQAGAPLDLSTLSAQASRDPALASPSRASPTMTGALPPPPPRNPSATGAPQQQAMLPPTATPKDEYDLAYGYLLRKDYALAEEGFRNLLRKYPNERLVAEANYWVGETLFQRQRYRDAAESFLTVSTKFEKSSKAPDALLRLGQSLAALKEKEAACATLSELGRKYPRASPAVKQGVEREQKRAGC